MKMIPVSSSAISAIGYEEPTRRMAVRFKQGKTYAFCRVPRSVFQAFLHSSSKGAYYDQYIRDRYQC